MSAGRECGHSGPTRAFAARAPLDHVVWACRQGDGPAGPALGFRSFLSAHTHGSLKRRMRADWPFAQRPRPRHARRLRPRRGPHGVDGAPCGGAGSLVARSHCGEPLLAPCRTGLHYNIPVCLFPRHVAGRASSHVGARARAQDVDGPRVALLDRARWLWIRTEYAAYSDERAMAASLRVDDHRHERGVRVLDPLGVDGLGLGGWLETLCADAVGHRDGRCRGAVRRRRPASGRDRRGRAPSPRRLGTHAPP